MIFDTHAHYDDERFDEDRDALLQSMESRGVDTIINVGASMDGSRNSVKLAEHYPLIYASVGVHPDDCRDFGEKEIAGLRKMAGNAKVVAIGEIGLDYAFFEEMTDEEIEAEKVAQKECFQKQLELARELQMPVFIHSRDAAEDTMQLMREHTKLLNKDCIPGIIHCYAYSVEMAKEYVSMGYLLGIGGVLTFKNARKLPDVVSAIPLEALVLETDSPYLAPVPHRGERNDSSNLTYVVAKIAEIKGVSEEDVIRITSANARKLLKNG